MNKSFYIGNVEFDLCSDVEFEISDELNKFAVPVAECVRKVTYQIEFEAEPKPKAFRFMASEEYPPQIIGKIGDGEGRIYQDVFTKQPVAIYEEVSEDSVKLTFCKAKPETFQIELNDLNYMGLERQLIKAGAMILHSSFIVQDGKAILFTAPSGTGKSTQADLWNQYREAVIMNGDRSLLMKTEDGWRVAGFPFSGSSRISHNGIFEIQAIIMIHQATENGGVTLPLAQTFKRIYPEIVKNYWDIEYDNIVCEQLLDMIQYVPAIAYGCNISENAVECLEQLIKTGE